MKLQKTFSTLFAIEGLIALAVLFSIPFENRTSITRLALIGSLSLPTLFWMTITVRPLFDFAKVAKPTFVIASTLLALSLSLILFFLRYLNPERLLPYYDRLSPLLWYLLIIALQTSFFFLLSSRGFHPTGLQQHKSTIIASSIFFTLLLIIFAIVALTRLGLTPDKAYWGEPGVAILGWQFGMALLGGFCIQLFFLRRSSNPARYLSSFFFPLTLWFIAIILWFSVPIEVVKNAFYASIEPPAFQPFPYSDAGYYDSMAQSLLIGHPYRGEIPTRPLYIVFLAALHLLFGENYTRILTGQTIVLALIPVVLYYLGKMIHSRAAGVTIALFAIFRELTSLWISSNTRVSNSRMLLVDLPTLFLLSLSCLFVMRWLEGKDIKSAFVAGGSFGLLLLLRTQSILILPFILLAALFIFGWRNKNFFLLSSFFFLGLIISIIPWLTHNYLQTGKIAFDAGFEYKLIASQYAYTGNLDNVHYDFANQGLAQVLIEFAAKDPKFVFGFISNHFLAAEVDGLLALPLIKPYSGIFQPVNLYWVAWNGSLEWYNVILLIVYLAVIAVGLGAAWRRLRWVGLLPLAFNIGYVLATAISRFSGWRYDFPADWVPYFYFGIGIVEIFILLASLFKVEFSNEIYEAMPDAIHTKDLLPYAALFLLIGALPWLATKIVSPRYADQAPLDLEQRLFIIKDAPSLSGLQTFVSQPNATIISGRLLYPRFYTRNTGLSSASPWPAYETRNYPRVGFILQNQGSMQVVFPSKGAPDVFPHAADTIMLGCDRGEYIEARLIAFPDLDLIYASAPITESCSP